MNNAATFVWVNILKICSKCEIKLIGTNNFMDQRQYKHLKLNTRHQCN